MLAVSSGVYLSGNAAIAEAVAPSPLVVGRPDLPALVFAFAEEYVAKANR